MAFSLRQLCALAVLPVLLAACSDDDPSRSGSGGDSSGATVSGSVVKGITANAVVTVYAPGDDGFTLLASDVSNEQGAFAVDLPDGFEGVVKVVATASVPPEAPTRMRCDAPSGCGDTPESETEANTGDLNGNNLVDFGEWFEVPADFELSAVAVVTGTGFRLINLTPLSTMAAVWAEAFPQGLDARSADAANAQMAALFGFALMDLEQGAGDLTDPLWLNVADPTQIELALLYATFAEAAALTDMTMQEAVDMLAEAFAAHQGRLQQTGAGPTLASLLGLSAMLAGVIDMPDTSYDQVNSSFTTLMESLQDGELTAVHEDVSLDHLLTQLGPLGEDLNELLLISGLNDPLQFLVTEGPYFAWLLAEDNVQLVPLAVDTVVFSLLGSLQLDLLPPETTTVTLLNDGMSVITLNVPEKTLTIVGTRHAQDVNLTVGLTGLLSGAEAGQFDYSIDGTASNNTAAGEIHGTLMIDTGDTDFGPLLSAFTALQTSDPNAGLMLQLALYNLANSLTANVTLAGEAQLINKLDPNMVLGGDVVLTAFLDLGAETGETIASLNVASGQIILPNGDRLYGLHDANDDPIPILTVVVGDDATLVLDGAATVFNIPEAVAHVEGELTNTRALFEHIRSTLITAVGGGSLEPGNLLADLFDFDFSQMSISGEGVIEIEELGHQYRATLDNLTATVYQPHSEEVAASATLDLDHQAVHMMIGDEPWDLRVMTTPTPRFVLLGPDGQFAEATQEDLFAFLDMIPLGDLLGGLFLPAVPET